MSQNKKAEALMRALEEKLRLRGAANIVKLNEAALRISQSAIPVDQEANMIIRIKPMADDIDRKDALGLAQRVYNPQLCEILLEDGAAAALQKQLSEAIFEISKTGLAIDVWQQAVDSTPVTDESKFAGATKLFSLKDLLHPALADT